jgi:hypothetical protein
MFAPVNCIYKKLDTVRLMTGELVSFTCSSYNGVPPVIYL